MANVATRRLFSRSLFALSEFTHLTRHNRCSSVFVINFNNKGNLTLNKNSFYQKPICVLGSYRMQQYSDCKEKKKEEKLSSDCQEKKKEEKLSLFQRFKQMYKDYWYVLVPVHVVTSAGWFGAFYYLAKSGVDVAGILESWSISEKITSPLKDSSMGYIAISYALYKIATPIRYTVTLGGTTISINYLKKWGYIKPVPSKERLKEIYMEKKDNIFETVRETKEGLKDKKENIIDDFDKSLKQIKELGGKVKEKESVINEVKKYPKKAKDKD